MRIVYTDENRKLKMLGELVNSQEFMSYARDNIPKMQKYSYNSLRVENAPARETFNKLLEHYGLFISTEVEHANGIGNNNAYYVQDLVSQEYIGCMNLNTDMYGGLYCYATDINGKMISNTYFMRDNYIKLAKTCNVNWDKYAFAQEDKALTLIEDAISLGVLTEGPNGGVMVRKVFHGHEAWEEEAKEAAAKDFVSSENVQMLLEAVNDKKEKNRRLEEVFERYKTSYLMSEYCNYVCHVENKELLEDRVVVHLIDDNDGTSWKHIVYVDENDELQIYSEFGVSLYDYAKDFDFGWSEDDIYKIKHGHVPFRDCEKGVLLEYKGILFDCWSIDKDIHGKETGSIWSEMCTCCAEKYKDFLKDELTMDGAVGACGVTDCFHRGDDEDSAGNYYVDFKPQLVKFIDVPEKKIGTRSEAVKADCRVLDEVLENAKVRSTESGRTNKEQKDLQR